MNRLALALMLVIASAGGNAAITIVNESTLVPLPNDPITAKIVRGQYGPELVVAGSVSDQTAAGASITTAEVNFVATAVDGKVLASGYTSLTFGGSLEWSYRGGAKGFEAADLVAQVKITDRHIVTGKGEARTQAEIIATITFVNESSLLPLSGAPITAKIVRSELGSELVVAGTVSDRIANGERLTAAEVNFVAVKADGSVLWSGPSDIVAGNRLEWRLLLKPRGIVDGNLIDQVKMTDRKNVTVELLEREAREQAEIIRQANLNREREERKQAEVLRKAALERERQTRKAALERERQRESAIRNRHWPRHIERAVIERKVMLGMNGAQVSMAWGKPDHINESINAYGKSEQWVYSLSSYVYFNNGLVTSIQSSR